MADRDRSRSPYRRQRGHDNRRDRSPSPYRRSHRNTPARDDDLRSGSFDSSRRGLNSSHRNGLNAPTGPRSGSGHGGQRGVNSYADQRSSGYGDQRGGSYRDQRGGSYGAPQRSGYSRGDRRGRNYGDHDQGMRRDNYNDQGGYQDRNTRHGDADRRSGNQAYHGRSDRRGSNDRPDRGNWGAGFHQRDDQNRSRDHGNNHHNAPPLSDSFRRGSSGSANSVPLRTPNKTPERIVEPAVTMHGPTVAEPEQAPEVEDVVVEVKLTPAEEEALIAEQRKKRFAKLAALKAQQAQREAEAKPDDVMQEAKQDDVRQERAPQEDNQADETTPQEKSNGSKPVPAATSQGDLAQVGPATESAVASSVQPAGQSSFNAADYDPTKDMEEDLRKAEKAKAEEKAKEDAKEKDEDEELDVDMFTANDEEFFEMISKEHQESSQGRVLDKSVLENPDDEQAYLRVNVNELICNKRYKVLEFLGKGTYANVVRAEDLHEKKLVAIKIIRKNDMMRSEALKEIKFLRRILEVDPNDAYHLVRFYTSFNHRGHLCLVFENLKCNLRDLNKSQGGTQGIALAAIKAYTKQIFIALYTLQNANIIHVDLKPDNILVAENDRTVKICDFGTAEDIRDRGNAKPEPYHASRFYRAPDIILGLNYTFAVDVWAIGCTLFELWTGRILFQGISNNQMLKAIQEVRGKFTQKFLKKCPLAIQHFNEKNEFVSYELDPLTGLVRVREYPIIKVTKDIKSAMLAAADDATNQADLKSFIDLVDKCLNTNPEKRITAEEALMHPFVNVLVRRPVA